MGKDEDMRIAIWGAGKRGEWFSNLLTLLRMPLEVVCYGDNNESLIGTTKSNVPVLSFKEVTKLYKERRINQIVLVTEDIHYESIIKQMSTEDIEELYMIPEFLHFMSLSIEDVERYKVKVDYKKPRLNYLEYHVCDHCNLNCKGCGHLCPLVKEPIFGDLDQYIKDLERIKELCWGVGMIRLMGGEPLLNDQLPEFIRESRRVFPDARVSVVSNGLLFSKASNTLLKTMQETKCILDVSLYKPTKKVVDKILTMCDENRIICNVSEEILQFRKKRTLFENENIQQSYDKCAAKNCHFLRNGKIAVCSMPLLTHMLNETFETGIQVLNEDVIDLYDVQLDGWTMVNKLSAPIPLCRYCVKDAELFDWDVADVCPQEHDWVIDVNDREKVLIKGDI